MSTPGLSATGWRTAMLRLIPVALAAAAVLVQHGYRAGVEAGALQLFVLALGVAILGMRWPATVSLRLAAVACGLGGTVAGWVYPFPFLLWAGASGILLGVHELRRAWGPAGGLAEVPAPPVSPASAPRGSPLVWALGLALATGLLSAWSGAPWSAWLLTGATLYLACYLPMRALFARDAAPALSTGLLFTILGLACAATLAMIALALGLPLESAVVPPLLVAGVDLARRRDLGLPPAPPPHERGPALLLGAVVLVLAGGLFIASARMGRGPFPPEFFGVDSAYGLRHVHSLLRGSGYPPPNLAFDLGDVPPPGYHHGAYAMAAFLARVSGLLPHQALFAAVAPLLVGGVLAAGLELNRRLAPALPAPLALLAVVSLHLPPNGLLEGLQHIVHTREVEPLLAVLRNPQSFGHGYPVTGDLLGTIGIFVAFSLLGRLGERRNRLLFALWVALLAKYKAPHFVGLGLGLGVWSLGRAARSRDRGPLAASLMALALALVFLAVLPGRGTVRLAWGYVLERVGSGVLLGGVFLTFPALLATRLAERPRRPPLWAALLCCAVFPNLAANVIEVYAYRLDNPFDTWQLATPGGHAAAVLIVAWLSAQWPSLSRWGRRLSGGLLLLVIAPALAHGLWCAGVLLVAPERGHEYVDNRPIAPALAAIQPMNQALLVSNELRYPAEGGTRDAFQLQLSALFGHACYAADLRYLEAHPERPFRWAIQRELRRPVWPTWLEGYAAKFGWTHLLIDRRAPAPARIPLRRIYADARFEVYAFAPSAR